MSTYSQLLYHIVWATHRRHPAFDQDNMREMHAYLHGILKNNRCHTHRIGGMSDHVHLLVGIPTDLAPMNLVRDLKASSSKWMRQGNAFSRFERWQEGYGIFTVDWARKDGLVAYIRGQAEHHRATSFDEEIRALAAEAGLRWNEGAFGD